MKIVVALVGLLLIATFNNLSPIITGETGFDPTGCYSGEFHDEMDYQQLYKNYVNNTAVGEDVCKTESRTLFNRGDKFAIRESLNNYPWLTPEPKFKPSENTWINEAGTHPLWEGALSEETAYIILCPMQLKVCTEAGSSDHGTTMELMDPNGRYKIRFDNMERWYCCMNRGEKRSTSTVTYRAIMDVRFTHTADACNTVLGEGDIIGIGNGNTKVTAYERSDTNSIDWHVISIKKFYTHD